jgi:hypothetical protein
MKFGVRNLLDSPIERTYGQSSQTFYAKYNRGRTFSFSLSCDF